MRRRYKIRSPHRSDLCSPLYNTIPTLATPCFSIDVTYGLNLFATLEIAIHLDDCFVARRRVSLSLPFAALRTILLPKMYTER